MLSRTSTHSIQAERAYEAHSTALFDRVAYALELLAILRPRLTVAVYSRARSLEVRRGGVRGASEGWATVGVPSSATRESIARALVELSGLEHEPFLLDLLCARPSSTAAHCIPTQISTSASERLSLHSDGL